MRSFCQLGYAARAYLLTGNTYYRSLTNFCLISSLSYQKPKLTMSHLFKLHNAHLIILSKNEMNDGALIHHGQIDYNGGPKLDYNGGRKSTTYVCIGKYFLYFEANAPHCTWYDRSK